MFGYTFQNMEFLRKRQLNRKLVGQNNVKHRNTVLEGVNEFKNKNENPALCVTCPTVWAHRTLKPKIICSTAFLSKQIVPKALYFCFEGP